MGLLLCHSHGKCSSGEHARAHGFASRGLLVALSVALSFCLGVALLSFSSFGSLPESGKQQGEARALFGFDLPTGIDANVGDVSLSNVKHAADDIKPADFDNDLNIASHKIAHESVMDDATSQKIPAKASSHASGMQILPHTDEVASKLDDIDTRAPKRSSKLDDIETFAAYVDSLPSQTDDVASEVGVPNSPPQTGVLASKVDDPSTIHVERANTGVVRDPRAEAKHAAEQVELAENANDVGAFSHELATLRLQQRMKLPPQPEELTPKLRKIGTLEAAGTELATARMNYPPRAGGVASKPGGFSSQSHTGEIASQLGGAYSSPQAGQTASKLGDPATLKAERATPNLRDVTWGDLRHGVDNVKRAEIDNDLSVASHGLEQDKVMSDGASNIPTQALSLLPAHTSNVKLPPKPDSVPGTLSTLDTDIVTLEAERGKTAAAHINVPPQTGSVVSRLSSVALQLDDPVAHESERAQTETTRTQLAETRKQKEQALEPWHHRLHRHHQESRGSALLSFTVHTIVLFTAAYLVRTYLPQPLPQDLPAERDPEIGRAAFAFGLFDEKESWGDDKWLCFFSCCCMGVRWAETLTNDKVRLAGSFWGMLTISLLATHELNHLTIGMGHILFVTIAVYYRQQLRERFGLKSGTVGTILQDCFVWCCCPCCAAAQEARQVERVSLTSIKDSPTLPVVAGTFVRNPNAGNLETGTSFSSNVGLLEAQE